LGVLRKRREWQRERSAAIQVPSDVVSSFAASLPFDLTGAQRRATQEILHDMAQAVPMSRLLQGDVGSGKTVVAVAAMLAAVRAGYQAALMAPTSILAQQHADTVAHMLEGVPDVQVALLEGSQSALAKSTTRERLARGEIDIAIGTHALIQEGVTFQRLGLVVVDEQHRFGVAQRQTLRDKNATFRPHMLAMSATPIPRTLALTIYGDLEVSVLDELPPHRKPVVTAVRSQSSRESVYGFVRTQLEQGHQAYIICPLVQESPQIDARAAVEEHERLSRDVFSQFRLGLLHGRVGAEEKETVMRRFKDGQYDILVSTAVVEVGVDVPNATVMLIEGAERFGLAQLHQFRGRVGRGDARAYCILLSDNTTEENMARLQIMADTNDGFVLAEKDLELRGPGDFLGVRQHGLPELKVAQLSDRGTLELARREALRIFEKDPELRSVEHRALAEQVESFWGTVSDA
jgi:ATP-dependent DNA helicase RecG